ncbi:MAG: response regulator [Chloroflexota bacterium]|nr:response regulator [Chloroflexota bacterium]
MAGQKILCVDDDTAMREIYRVQLERQGYRVTVAGNGLDAMKAIETQGPPDLVVTDVAMPVMNGLDLIKHLREDQRTARTPILIVSEETTEKDALAGYTQGADDFIAKPVDMAILVAKIETIFRQTRPAAQLITAPPPRARGAVIAFVHAKGGVGTTTLAVNVAVARAREGPSTLLIDLNLQFGNAAMFLDLPPRYTIADLARLATATVTDELFAQFLTDHESGLQILAAPLSPEEGALVTVGIIQQAIDVARSERDAVLIDLPSTLDEPTLAAIDAADVVCVVTAPHLAALRATTDLLATLSRIGKSKDRTIVVCDRIRPKGIEDAACAKFLKRKIDMVIPYAEKADAAADLGVPYVLAEKADKTSLAIKELAAKLGTFKPVLA